MQTIDLKLNLNIKVFNVIKQKNPDFVIQYLQNEKISFLAKTEGEVKYSILHIAILNEIDALSLVKNLFEQQNSLFEKSINELSVKNESIIVFAARNIQNNSLEIMKFLVENGADPEAKTQDDKPLSSLLNETLKKQWDNFLQDYKARKQLVLEKEKAKELQSSKSSLDQCGLFFKRFFSSCVAVDEQKTPLLEYKFKKD